MALQTHTLVIGAGMAGLTVAAGLARAGVDHAVLEKSRGLGGRLATRRAGDLRFDHGAQYVRPEDAAFADHLAGLGDAAAVWQAAARDDAPALVGVPGMSALVKPLAVDVTVLREVEAAGLQRDGDHWTVFDAAGGACARAARIVLAVPAPQAQRLLGEHRLAAALDAVVFAPCWTLMVAFAARPDLPDTARDADATLSWIARDSGKPGRAREVEAWVAQAGAAWSRDNLEIDKAQAAERLLAELARRAGGALPQTVHVAAHRWRYSQAVRPLGAACLSAPEDGLVVAGDWCLGARVEHAFLSGRAALAALGHAAGP